MHQATDSSRLDAIETELAYVKRTNRRWRCSATLALLALAMIGLTGQVMPPSRVLEVEQLIVRDASGRIRASLGALDDESIVLTFRDQFERDRLAIGLLSEGTPLLGLYDEHRRRRAAFGMLDGNAPGLSLYGKDGTSRARLMVEDDRPRFVGQSPDGTVLWETPSPKGAP